MKPIAALGAAYHLVAEDQQQRAISAIKKQKVDTIASKPLALDERRH